MRNPAVQTDWIPRNEYTTPLKGVMTYRNAGAIKAVGPYGEKYSVGRIEYQQFEDESYQYIITPFWNVIDGVSTKVFGGIPGIKMELRLEHYYRANYTPVFMTERTPSPQREDMWELMESVGLDYYDRLEWLIRTPLRSGNDNLIVERWRDTPLRVGYSHKKDSISINESFLNVDPLVFDDEKKLLEILQYGDTVVTANLQCLSPSSDGLTEILAKLLGIGVGIECAADGMTIQAADIPVLLPVLTAQRELYLKNRKEKQREGIALAKQQGMYKGRKKLAVDEIALRSAYDQVRMGRITVKEAMQELNISSRSTYYRRIRELRYRMEQQDC